MYWVFIHTAYVRRIGVSQNGIIRICFSSGGGFLNVVANLIFMLRLQGLYRDQKTGKPSPSSAVSDFHPDRSRGS